MSFSQAAGLFALIALVIVGMGWRSMAGGGRVRKWVAIGVRLAVTGLLICILAGPRWQREHHDLEVMVVRDISQSTRLATDYPKVSADESLRSSLDRFLAEASAETPGRKPKWDKIGQVSFARDATIDAMPYSRLVLDARAMTTVAPGTDVASAIQLALASFSRDAMRRMVLIWDGNATEGDTRAAIDAAIAQHVPIDVAPLVYDVQREVIVERLAAPTWRRVGEDFTLEVVLKSTNPAAVNGRLTVFHQNRAMDLDPATPGVQGSKILTLSPGLNVERIKVPGQEAAGVHQFRAEFEPSGAAGVSDTLIENNSATAFTFVRGKGRVLYVDNVPGDGGRFLAEALAGAGIATDAERRRVDRFPTDIVTLQNYDAVILANVPRSAFSEDQQRLLAAYVHDTGGGLVMIGGEQGFGAGGWRGSTVEKILPVNMDIPAERQIAKGALVLIMHACEFADGNYWGGQCALKAAEALGDRDEVGVITFTGGGSRWDYPLQPKGDGAAVAGAIKAMTMGDMPSFDDSLNVALHGNAGGKGLLASDARKKHIIIISDGDPTAPAKELLQECIDRDITISTVMVYPHPGYPVSTMRTLAEATGGRMYGPINDNPDQLPQIFIKEATVVRRSLLQEDSNGIPLNIMPGADDMTRGIGAFPPIFGLVLTTKKSDPQVEMPLAVGSRDDPVLASWRTGLGRSAAFTSDATNKWAANWVGSDMYGKFWAQVVRSVSRAPMSGDFDIQTRSSGDRGKVVVEALSSDRGYDNFLSIAGQVMGPDLVARDVRLVQTGPGAYEADFATPAPGNYVLVLTYRGGDGKSGLLLGGLAINGSEELRSLRSRDDILADIARRTGGKVLSGFDPATADLFRRQGLERTASPLPIWDLLVPLAMGLFVVDVATRRLAWDFAAIAGGARRFAGRLMLSRRVETRQSLDALKAVRDRRESERGDGAADAGAPPPPLVAGATRPRPAATGLSSRTGAEAPKAPSSVASRPRSPEAGVTDEAGDNAAPAPRPPTAGGAGQSPPPPATDTTGGLLEAKRRARRRMGGADEEHQ